MKQTVRAGRHSACVLYRYPIHEIYRVGRVPGGNARHEMGRGGSVDRTAAGVFDCDLEPEPYCHITQKPGWADAP